MSPGAASNDEAKAKRAHFVFIPLMAPGHIIPAIDTALLLSTHGALCTIIATPATAARVRPSIEQSGLEVHLVEFPLEYVADGKDNLDNIPPERFLGYFPAVALLRGPVEEYLRTRTPRVTCIVSDFCHPWTGALAASLGVPRLTFFSMPAFSILCEHNMEKYQSQDAFDGDEAVVVPGMEKRTIRLTWAQTPRFFRLPWWGTLRQEIDRAQAEGGGVIINTFQELEPDHLRGLAAAWGKKVWSVGPVSLIPGTEVVTRGDSSSNDCLEWLDGKEPGTVVYISLGTISKMDPEQVLELGLGLEMSGHPFIWVFGHADHFGESVQGLQARVGSNGLIVRGWAPQVRILSHAAVGVFLTHCGWNSLRETIAIGKPVVTWPRSLGSDQQVNENLVVEELGIGLSVGMAITKDKSILIRREVVQAAVTSVLGGGEDGKEMRSQARALSQKARVAMEAGGSSHANLLDLVNRFSI